MYPNEKLILVVDDDRSLRRSLRTRLEDAGFEVEEAGSGRMALGWLECHSPDAVILDANMPDMSGLDVCDAIRCGQGDRNVPVIFLSGAEAPSLKYVERCAAAVGGTHFLRKPCDHEVLLDLLDTVTSRREAVAC